MMDPTAFIALLERCAPGAAVQPLAAAARQASGHEPFVIGTVQGAKPLSVQATSEPEGMALATGVTIAGQRVRIGLDARALERLGVPVADAVEPCPQVKAAARLMGEDPRRLKPTTAAARSEAR